MNADASTAAPSVREVVARLTAPGSPFELTDLVIDGRVHKAYAKAPATLPELLNAARSHGPKEYLVSGNERWTVQQLFAAADALAGRLQAELGVRPGDRVAIAMRNRPEWVIAFVATALTGAVPTPLNSLGLGDELRAAIADTRPTVLVCDGERLERLGEGFGGHAGRVVAVPGSPGEPVPPGVQAWAGLVQPGGPALQPPALQADDPALILFTSGSAARAKPVLSSQLAVCQSLMNIDFIGALSALCSPQAVARLMARALPPTTLTAVPLFHVSGLHAQMLTALRNGRRLVFLPRWSPEQALQLMQAERVTQFNGAPSMVMQLMEHPAFDPATNASSLGAVGFGGAGLPQRLIEQVLGRMPDSMSGIGYGLTESNGAGSAASGRLFAQRPQGSGVVSPIVELRIADPQGAPLPAGEDGEIWLRGVTLMTAYWNQPQATAAALNDGWFRTGDVGHVDAEGFLFVVDRIKDVINRAGEKVASAEVESCLMQHPAVAEAAVVAVPDESTGEAVAAMVSCREGQAVGAEELQAFVAQRLARHKVPARLVVSPVPLPRSATGKALKNDVRKRLVGP